MKSQTGTKIQSLLVVISFIKKTNRYTSSRYTVSNRPHSSCYNFYNHFHIVNWDFCFLCHWYVMVWYSFYCLCSNMWQIHVRLQVGKTQPISQIQPLRRLVIIEVEACWVMTPCSVFQNMRILPQQYIVSQPRRQLESSPPWKSQISYHIFNSSRRGWSFSNSIIILTISLFQVHIVYFNNYKL
jgi:hypothetical protein